MVPERTDEALRESENKFRQLFTRMPSAVAIYDAVDNGEDFIFKDFNTAAEKIEGIKKDNLIGKRVTQIFPGVKDFGIFAIFQRVWRTGQPEFFPSAIYRDEREPGTWRENWVFRLASGEVVAIYHDITERKRMEEALQESEEKYRLLSESSPDHVIVQDLDLRYVYVLNPQLGLKLEDMLGRTDYDFLDKEDASKLTQIKQDVIRTGTAAKYETFLISKSGEKEYFEGTYVPKYDKEGKIDGLMGYFRNVTEHKAAEEEIKSANAFLDIVIDMSPFSMWISDKEGTVTRVNRSLCQTINLTPGEIVGKYNVIRDTNLEIQGVMPDVKAVFDKYTPTRFIIPWKAADAGNIDFQGARDMYIDVSLFPILNNRGELTNVVCQWVDVTEQKKAEDALIKSQIQLGEAMDLAHLVNWEFDVATGIFTFNDRFYALYATTAEREGGYQMPAEVYAREFVHPDDQHVVADEVNKAIQATDPGFVSYIEHRIIRRDGEIRYIIVRFGITKNAQGRTIKTHGANQDITDRKLMEEEIRSLNRALEQRVEQRTEALNKSLHEKDILFKEVHHRVKNNMQIIISLLNLQSRTIDDPVVLKTIKESQSRIKAMALVHERLYRSGDISRIDLKDYIQFLARELFSFYGVKSQLIRFTINAPAINVNIDTAIPLGLMVNELISNAIKYAFPEGRKGEIVIDITKDKNTISLVVRDNGAGIPADFDWRNSKSLGIRLVTSLVEQLQGTIELDRTAGTAFNIVVKEKE
jgi:PAS domain S-box-containing protein